MEIFDREDVSVNFVDENDVVLGYSLRCDCCEDAGWYIVDDEPTTVDLDLRMDASGYEQPPQDIPELAGWVFDRNWFKQIIEYCSEQPPLDCGGAVCFRIVLGDQQKFVVLFNSQNGYYSHGFEFKAANEVLQSDSI